jgi:hypothetical protein
VAWLEGKPTGAGGVNPTGAKTPVLGAFDDVPTADPALKYSTNICGVTTSRLLAGASLPGSGGDWGAGMAYGLAPSPP